MLSFFEKLSPILKLYLVLVFVKKMKFREVVIGIGPDTDLLFVFPSPFPFPGIEKIALCKIGIHNRMDGQSEILVLVVD